MAKTLSTPLCIRFVLKPHDRVVGKAHHERAAVHSRRHLFGEPLVEHIVEVDITELRRDYPTLGSSRLRIVELSLLQYARV